MKLLVAALLALVSSGAAFAQNPQTQSAPVYGVNAKWVNGFAPGYLPCGTGAINCPSVTGLHLQVGPGTVICSGAPVTYAGGTFTLTASTTNYVYLNVASSCAPAVKTTPFAAPDIPIATVVTGASAITSLGDDRTFFNGAIGAAANPASPSFAVQFANSGATAFQADSTYTFNPTTHALTVQALTSLNKTVMVDQQAGATADVKLAACISSLSSTGGTCDATGFGGTTQTLAATVTTANNVFLKLSPATIYQPGSASVDGFHIAENSGIDGLTFNGLGVSNYAGAAVTFQDNCQGSVADRCYFTNFKLINGTNSTNPGTGTAILLKSSSGYNQATVEARGGVIIGFHDAIYLNSTSGGFVNGNNFRDIDVINAVNCINLFADPGDVMGNKFNVDCETAAGNIVGAKGIWVHGSTSGVALQSNQFTSGNMWDYGTSVAQAAYTLDPYSSVNFLQISIPIGGNDTSSNLGTNNRITNLAFPPPSPPTVLSGFLNMESTSSYWSICDGSCAGGGGTPSVGPTQTFSLSAPSEASFTATANSTNVLFVSKPPGAWNTSSNDFTFGVWYYPTNATGVNEHEFDQVMVTASATEWMFGHQCVVGGVWDIWNQSSLTWIPTSAPCSLSVNAWHQLIFHDYKIAGDTTGCGGHGCMYFGSLTVDGVTVYNLNQAEPAGPTPGGWGSFAGVQVQEDVNTASVGSPVSVVSYYKWIDFTQRN